MAAWTKMEGNDQICNIFGNRTGMRLGVKSEGKGKPKDVAEISDSNN